MCKIIAIRHVEDCFDGNYIKEFELDIPLNESIMRRIANEAQLQYFPDFPKPYFRIDRCGLCTVQGVIGKTTFRVTFARSKQQEMENLLVKQIEKGESDG